MKNRSLTWIALGVAVPAVVLAGGWLFASLRERDLRAEQLEQRLTRSAFAIRAAVDEGLEELRRQEDARPFYLYNHYYSPPDVIALSDPVARSPLAREDLDLRIRGHFQIDPSGDVRTPFDDDGAEPSAQGALVRAVVGRAELEPLRARARRSAEAEQRLARYEEAVVRYASARTKYSGNQRNSGKVADNTDLPALIDENPANVGNYTVSLNSWGSQLYNDIKNVAQKKVDVSADQLIGRSAPRINRRNVPDPESTAQQKRSKRSPQQDVQQQAQAVEPAPKPRPKPRKPKKPDALPPSIADGVPMGPEVTVDYTAMAYERFGSQLVLAREVTHEGVTSVQGVLLDEEKVQQQWLPAVIRRHVTEDVAPKLVLAEEAQDECFVRAPVSSVLRGPALCFPDQGARAQLASYDESLYAQTGALGFLLLILALAIFAVIRAAKQSAALVEQRSSFISAVSHELRTPITTLRMNAEMLRDGMVAEARRPRFLSNMVGEAVRLSHLVANVLEIARLDQGRRPIKKVEIDVAPFLSELAGTQSSFCDTRGFTLSTEAPDDLVLMADRQALEQILVNLVENGAKYAADSHDKSLLIQAKVREGDVVFHVLDRGPGIEEKDKARVFERFVRADHGKKHVVGTGLGLALVRDLARAHGGDVEIHDREGGGTDVRVRLPRGRQ